MPPARRIPGEAGIWVLILGELCLFSAFFVTIALARGQDPAHFLQSQATLNRTLGLTNTLLLLTSSLFAAMALHRVREGLAGAPRLFLFALMLGLGFVAIKLTEYSQKIAAGVDFSSGDFFMFYFAFTGVHLMHVLVGIAVLGALARIACGADAASRTTLIECGVLFWHLVDLLWIVLFALFYLAK